MCYCVLYMVLETGNKKKTIWELSVLILHPATATKSLLTTNH